MGKIVKKQSSVGIEPHVGKEINDIWRKLEAIESILKQCCLDLDRVMGRMGIE